MQASDVKRTQDAWRDFAIGLALLFWSLRVFQFGLLRYGYARNGFAPATSIATQALLIGGILLAHLVAFRFGKLTEVTGAVSSFGRISPVRLALVSAAAAVLMFGVWQVAQMIGGPIDSPLPGGRRMFDRSRLPAGLWVAVSFYFAVSAPVIEELCFRGWVQRGLGQRFRPAVAILTPALLFAALHASMYGHPAYLLIPLALGLILGLVAERSRSLWPSILMHMLWNVTMLTIAVRNANGPPVPEPQGALDLLIVLVAISLGCFALLRILSDEEVRRTDGADVAPVLGAQEAA